MATYSIIRTYQDKKHGPRILKSNVTLAQAQAHCQSGASASSTCTTPAGLEHTAKHGSWHDSYTPN